MEQVLTQAFTRLFGWDVLSLAGGIYFLMMAVKVVIGDAPKDHPVVNRLLFVAPFLVCAALAFVPGMFDDVTSWGGKVRMGLWTGGISMLYFLVVKFVFGDKVRNAIAGKVRSVIKKGS